MISPSTPFLTLESRQNEEPLRATFVGYFKLDDVGAKPSQSSLPEIVESVPAFEPRPLEEKSAYRMVRVSIEAPLRHRICRAVSDIEVIREKDFDWSLIPTRKEGEKVVDALRRRAELWAQSRVCPNPRMYEVLGSPWIAELHLENDLPWHHYILLGHDDFIEVIGRSWSWEPGQPIWQ